MPISLAAQKKFYQSLLPKLPEAQWTLIPVKRSNRYFPARLQKKHLALFAKVKPANLVTAMRRAGWAEINSSDDSLDAYFVPMNAYAFVGPQHSWPIIVVPDRYGVTLLALDATTNKEVFANEITSLLNRVGSMFDGHVRRVGAYLYHTKPTELNLQILYDRMRHEGWRASHSSRTSVAVLYTNPAEKYTLERTLGTLRVVGINQDYQRVFSY